MRLFAAFLLAFTTGTIAGVSTSPVGTTLVAGLGILVLASLGVRGFSIDPLKRFADSGNPPIEPPKRTDASGGSGTNSENGLLKEQQASPALVTALPISTPMMIALCFGLALGIVLGIVARTHFWLSPSPSAVVLRYKNPQLKEDEILRTLMHAELGATQGALANTIGRGGLFAAELPQGGCDELIKKRKANKLTADDLKYSNHAVFTVMGGAVDFRKFSSKELGDLVAAFCPDEAK